MEGLPRETADIETASEDYATRFSGPIGEWLLWVQAEKLRKSLQGLPPDCTVLDVGGGHAQTAPVALAMGHAVTVTGSDPACGARLPGGIPFVLADHPSLPFPDQSFDAVLCFRFLPHCERWPELVAELCRVARHRVVVDYPARRSVNFFADKLFALKKNVEKNTRPFTLFHHGEVADAFSSQGFIPKRHPQFFWPMVLHRMHKTPALARALEAPCRLLGLTALLGSPVVLEARRG